MLSLITHLFRKDDYRSTLLKYRTLFDLVLDRLSQTVAMSNTSPAYQEKKSPTDTQAVRNQTDLEHVGIPDEPPNDDPPDGGYGWVVVVSIVFMTASTWGRSATSNRQPVHC